MPLKKSGSEKSLHENIKEMIKSGHKHKQAVAAALTQQRKYKKMYDGGMVEEEESYGHHDMDDNIGAYKAGKPVYPEQDAGEQGLSHNVYDEGNLVEHLEQARYSANQSGTLKPDMRDVPVSGRINGMGEVEPMSGDETPEVHYDGTEEPMSSMPHKPSSLGHAMVGGVPASPALSQEAKMAIMKKKQGRRFF